MRDGAHAAVDRASSSSGAPLPGQVRGRFEASLGADLSGVRVHTGSASAEAADAVGAKAYTVGNDIHFAQQQDATDPSGLHLLAHEVAHTQQQSGGGALRRKAVSVTAPTDTVEREADHVADAMVRGEPAPAVTRTAPGIAREPDPALAALGIGKDDPHAEPPATGPGTFGPKYKAPQAQYDQARANEGKVLKAPDGEGGTVDSLQATMRPASQANRNGKSGTPMDPSYQITDTDLVYIMRMPGAPLTGKMVVTQAASASSVNEAFKLMGIDTLEAQAAYLAHASVESEGFQQMNAQADKPSVVGEFKGRGPLQVTLPENYIKSLAYLDLQAERLAKAGKADEAARLQEASRAVKADPAAAADPKYAFIFSAAHMHASGGVEKVESLKGRTPVFNGNGDEDSWEAGGAGDFSGKLAKAKERGDTGAAATFQHLQEAGQRKKGAYARAIERLSPHVLKAPPAPPTPAAPPTP